MDREDIIEELVLLDDTREQVRHLIDSPLGDVARHAKGIIAAVETRMDIVINMLKEDDL